jgi:integrase/recombinase XerD
VKTPKVRLYIRVRHSDRRYAYHDPAWNRNRTLRAHYALVDGQPEHHPEGVYYLRFLRGGRRLWESVGSEPDGALSALRNTEHDLDAIALGRKVLDPLPTPISTALAPNTKSAPAPLPSPVATPTTGPPVSLKDAIETYLSEVRRFRSKRTIAACENILNLFAATNSKAVTQEMERGDLLDHIADMHSDRNLARSSETRHDLGIPDLGAETRKG